MNATTKHAPGSWTLDAGRTIHTPSGDFYLTYGTDRAGNALFRDFCELDTIAHQVAALPDLLAALESIARGLTNGQKQRGETFQTIARAALRLARGA